MAQQLSTNTFGATKWIVATNAWEGTHTTLAGAIASASSGDTIFLRNSVTENVTLTPGVNITAWAGGTLNTPTITGTITMTGAGTSTISGLILATNGAAIIAVTGSAASILNVNNCYLRMGSNAITYSSSSSSSALNLNSCNGDITAAATLMFAHSSAGVMTMRFCNIQNTGASTQQNTQSAGTLNLFQTLLSNPLITSGTTATFANNYSIINCNTLNVTALTHGCTNATASGSNFGTYASGTASAISVSATCSLNSSNDNVGSNATNAVTGSGIITYGQMSYFGTSSLMNTTTQNEYISDLGYYKARGQPCFYGLKTSATANATGDGTGVTIATTEQFDQNGDFDGTTFTAPVAGKYWFNVGVFLSNIGTHNSGALRIVATSQNFLVANFNPTNFKETANTCSITGSVIVSLAAGNTVTALVAVAGSTKTVALEGTASTLPATFFQGYLIA